MSVALLEKLHVDSETKTKLTDVVKFTASFTPDTFDATNGHLDLVKYIVDNTTEMKPSTIRNPHVYDLGEYIVSRRNHFWVENRSSVTIRSTQTLVERDSKTPPHPMLTIVFDRKTHDIHSVKRTTWEYVWGGSPVGNFPVTEVKLWSRRQGRHN